MNDPGRVTLRRAGAVAHVTFDRPKALNALTLDMYRQLDEICIGLSADADLRAVVFRGTGGKAFIAGTDISEFLSFETGKDGIAYEKQMDGYANRVAAIPVPTIAVVEGWAVGGGFSIAAVCDLRIATTGSKFGSPIARTVGNCLSMRAYRVLLGTLGESRAKRVMLLGEMIGAEEALAAGFLARLVEPEALDSEVTAMVERLLANAPITMQVSKEAMRRIQAGEAGDGADLIDRTYSSDDFKTGVKAFTGKTKPEWTGR